MRSDERTTRPQGDDLAHGRGDGDWFRPGLLTRLRSARGAWLRALAALAAAVVLAALLGLLACAPAGEAQLVPRSTLFIGVDVSGSFQDDGRWDDAMDFAAHYIYGHLNGKGELDQPRALFVGAIGGETPGEPQAFHPIHDFEGKTPARIEADLRGWFAPDDRYTDFNAFFRRAAALVQQRNLILAPITLVLLTDGVPDVGHQGPAADAERFARIDLDPLEYLARNVTVRVLYPDPPVAVNWERAVPRDRVRMWTVDHVVMRGWREQHVAAPDPPPAQGDSAAAPDDLPFADTTAPAGASTAGAADTLAADELPIYGERRNGPSPSTVEVRGVRIPQPEVPLQPELWRWIHDNVDFRVGRRVF